MNFNEIYSASGDSLKAEDLNNSEHTLTMTGYEVKDFKEDDGYSKQKIILRFQGLDKTLVLNKTNGSVIADAIGPDVDTWAGNQIILYPTVTDFGGKQVPCIRVRPVLQAATQPIGQAASAQQYANASGGSVPQGMNTDQVPTDNYKGIG